MMRLGTSHRRRGQALVEFALVIPIFLLGLFGLIDGSRLVFLNSTLSQAAREGARLASVEASFVGSTDGSCNTAGGPICPASPDAMKADIVSAVNRMMTPFAAIPASDVYLSCDASLAPSGEWTGSSCASGSSGDLVSVRVIYTYVPFTPLIGQLIGNRQLSGSATMVIN
jgi:hypothetical protein